MKQAIALAGLVALAACSGGEEADAPPDELALDSGANDGEADSIDDIEIVGELLPDLAGATPMEERVATIGVLNKRNGVSQDIELRPGQARRVGDALIRLRACERTAPWEPQQLTGAFIQLFIRDPDSSENDPRWQRVFSGWLFKERPSLNIVEHRIYDVWPKDCEMTYPDSAPSESTASGNSASSARRSPPASDSEPSDDSAASSNEA